MLNFTIGLNYCTSHFLGKIFNFQRDIIIAPLHFWPRGGEINVALTVSIFDILLSY